MSKQIPLTQGKFSIVDDEDENKILSFNRKWCYSKRGYAELRTEKNHIYMHRFILGIQGKSRPLTDHKNGDQLDNRKENLRFCTHGENMRNSKVRSHSTTGIKGVRKTKFGKYFVQITANGTVTNVGNYDCPFDAAQAYNMAAKKLHGAFARLNNLPSWYDQSRAPIKNKCGGDRYTKKPREKKS